MEQGQQATQEGYLYENYHYFHLRDTAGQERSFHFHTFDKLVLLREGRVRYIVENRTYELTPGSVLMVPHHAIHKAVIDQSTLYDRIIIYLDRRFFEQSMMTSGLLECFLRADRDGYCLLQPSEKRSDELNRTIADFEAAQKDRDLGAEAIRDTIMLQLLIRVNRIASEAAEAQPESRTGGKAPALRADTVAADKIRLVRSYINEHLQEELSVDALADRVYLSRYYFMRLFREQTGSTVHAYIQQKRLLYASRLIRAGVPAGEAAAESGFSDYSVFHRAFRKSFGISPSQLMKKS